MKFVITQWKGVMSALIVAGLLTLLLRIRAPWMVLVSLAVWGATIFLLFRHRLGESAIRWNVALLGCSYIGALLLLSLTEWETVTRSILIIASVSIGSLVSIIDADEEDTQVYIRKACRRILVMGWVFVCASLLVASHAMSVFFPGIPVWVLFLFVGAYTSAIAYAVWRMYYPLPIRRFSVWILIMAVMSMEFFWVLYVLPFGYIVLGFLSTWIWYLLVLLIRFHMSSEGIRWKKQRKFLVGNSILFIIILFLVRWI
jgi:hypothetical protein